MLDTVLNRFFAPLLDRAVAVLRPIMPVLDVVSLCFALAGAVAIARHMIWPGLAVFAASRLLSAVAARGGRDAVCAVFEAVAFSALPFAFAMEAPERALASVFLIFGLSANTAASLACGRRLIGATELLAVFAVMAAFPVWFGAIAYTVGIACFAAAGVVVSGRRA
jgi:hypothetical protein